ncbi:hypothetical protein Hanom_Chr12g01147871 [Helianthus anomalus]
MFLQNSIVLNEGNCYHEDPIMIHDPDPEVLLRITICQRNEDHWLGSRVRITYNKNPALTIAPKI